MLPDIQLDQMTFEEMIERAKNRIISSYPEWTDFNYHDPGMTLVELFAWLSEIQQYELNHISDEHRYRYLKLLGEEVLHRTGAVGYASTGAEYPVRIPAGTPLRAPGMTFQTVREQFLPGVSVSQCFGLLETKVSYLHGEQLNLGYGAEFYPFGREAKEGTSLYVSLSAALPAGEILGLTVRTAQNQPVRRNPSSADTIPLAQLSYACWNGSSWRELEIIEDTTFGLLYDGQLLFRLTEEMKACQADGEDGFYLRVTLEESHYDLPPVLSFLDMNTLAVCQKESAAVWLAAEKLTEERPAVSVKHNLCAYGKLQVFMELDGFFYEVHNVSRQPETEIGTAVLELNIPAEQFENGQFWVVAAANEDWYDRHRVLGQAKGFPNERFSLDETVLSWEDVELLVEEPECPGVFRKWEKREDFSHSGPEDYHYRADPKTGQVIFGDCFKGRAPEGQILLISYSRVLGERGNIKAGKISGFRQSEWCDIPVSNLWDTWGGRDEETMDGAFARVRARLREARSMVTEADYEQAILRTPGLCVESCKALAGVERPGECQNGEQVMRLVIKPGSLKQRPKMSAVFAENIRKYLEPRRMLGMELRLLSPAYVHLTVYLEVQVHPQYQDAGRLVEQAVRDYLKPVRNTFGSTVSYSGLYGYLDRLPCVAAVRSLVLDGKGNGVRKNSGGDLIFPGNGVADEIEIHCSCSVMD